MIDVLLCNEKHMIEKEKVVFLLPVAKQFVGVGERIIVDIQRFLWSHNVRSDKKSLGQEMKRFL